MVKEFMLIGSQYRGDDGEWGAINQAEARLAKPRVAEVLARCKQSLQKRYDLLAQKGLIEKTISDEPRPLTRALFRHIKEHKSSEMDTLKQIVEPLLQEMEQCNAILLDALFPFLVAEEIEPSDIANLLETLDVDSSDSLLLAMETKQYEIAKCLLKHFAALDVLADPYHEKCLLERLMAKKGSQAASSTESHSATHETKCSTADSSPKPATKEQAVASEEDGFIKTIVTLLQFCKELHVNPLKTKKFNQRGDISSTPLIDSLKDLSLVKVVLPVYLEILHQAHYHTSIPISVCYHLYKDSEIEAGIPVLFEEFHGKTVETNSNSKQENKHDDVDRSKHDLQLLQSIKDKIKTAKPNSADIDEKMLSSFKTHAIELNQTITALKKAFDEACCHQDTPSLYLITTLLAEPLGRVVIKEVLWDVICRMDSFHRHSLELAKKVDKVLQLTASLGLPDVTARRTLRAITLSNTLIVEWLLKQYPHRKDDASYFIALADTIIYDEREPIFILLIQHGFDPRNAAIFEGSRNSLLMEFIAKRFDDKILQGLLKAKVDINYQNPVTGHTALTLAVSEGQVAMASVLIKQGANCAAVTPVANAPLPAGEMQKYKANVLSRETVVSTVECMFHIVEKTPLQQETVLTLCITLFFNIVALKIGKPSLFTIPQPKCYWPSRYYFSNDGTDLTMKELFRTLCQKDGEDPEPLLDLEKTGQLQKLYDSLYAFLLKLREKHKLAYTHSSELQELLLVVHEEQGQHTDPSLNPGWIVVKRGFIDIGWLTKKQKETFLGLTVTEDTTEVKTEDKDASSADKPKKSTVFRFLKSSPIYDKNVLALVFSFMQTKPRTQNCFAQFLACEEKQKNLTLNTYLSKFPTFNQHWAAEMATCALTSFSKQDLLLPIYLHGDSSDKPFELEKELTEQLVGRSETTRYIYFTLSTKDSNYGTPIVIDLKTKNIHVVDPLLNQTGSQKKAETLLQNIVSNEESQFYGFRIIIPGEKCKPQLSTSSNQGGSVAAAASIVGIVLKQEQVSNARQFYVDLETGEGLTTPKTNEWARNYVGGLLIGSGYEPEPAHEVAPVRAETLQRQ